MKFQNLIDHLHEFHADFPHVVVSFGKRGMLSEFVLLQLDTLAKYSSQTKKLSEIQCRRRTTRNDNFKSLL